MYSRTSSWWSWLGIYVEVCGMSCLHAGLCCCLLSMGTCLWYVYSQKLLVNKELKYIFIYCVTATSPTNHSTGCFSLRVWCDVSLSWCNITHEVTQAHLVCSNSSYWCSAWFIQTVALCWLGMHGMYLLTSSFLSVWASKLPYYIVSKMPVSWDFLHIRWSWQMSLRMKLDKFS